MIKYQHNPPSSIVKKGIWKQAPKRNQIVIKQYQNLPQQYLGTQAQISVLDNFWRQRDKMGQYQNWRLNHMLMFQVKHKKGIIDLHHLKLKSVNCLKRKIQKYYQNIYDRIFEYWSSEDNLNPSNIKSHIINHMKEKSKYFILVMIPGKGKKSKVVNMSKKILTRIPQQFTHQHKCQVCTKFFTSQIRKEGGDIVLKKIYKQNYI